MLKWKQLIKTGKNSIRDNYTTLISKTSSLYTKIIYRYQYFHIKRI